MKTIFVQIASYRDTELPSTIDDCLSMARHPERLNFGICWQYDEETVQDLEDYLDDPRFRVDKIHYSESKGCCWARNRTNQLYRDETYTLQIDAHMRFLQDWDVRMIEMLESIDHDKPLLSTYPPPYLYQDDNTVLKKDHGIQTLKLKKWRSDLSTIQEGEQAEQTERPGKSKFLAAGYIFTLGRFCREVEYDPKIYFQGEEISLAARAYTHGYNLYYPHEDLVWHLYAHGSPLHWSDHKSAYVDMARQGSERLEKLFLGDHTELGKHGLGKIRTLAQFEDYAEVRFNDAIELRKQGGETRLFKTAIKLNTYAIERRTDYESWVFYLFDEEDRELCRIDITDPEIIVDRVDRLEIEQEITGIPARYMIWPKTADGWGEKYNYPLDPEISDPKSDAMQNSEQIFIALASYCEPELALTIKDCIDKAVYPGRLRFGVCLQYDNEGEAEIQEDCIDDLVEQYKIRLVKYPYQSSQGGCWARNIVQSLYRDEKYTLQIDAHSRMVEGWDEVLINMMEELPSNKPLITGFPPLYFINDGVETFTSIDDLSCVPTTTISFWSKDGWIEHPTTYLPQNTSTPRRTRVLSGAFVFTYGCWNTEVNQDPYFTYTGEEFALALRSYTSGYDLFNPTQIVVWHRNHPEPNRKFINEFDEEIVLGRQKEAFRRLHILLAGDPDEELVPFSLGRKRSLDDYRIFAGLDCATREIHEDAHNGVPPDPVTLLEEYTHSEYMPGDNAGELLDLTVQLEGMEALELRCASSSPVLADLMDALEVNINRQTGDADPMMFLQFGDDEDHEIYFPQSRLLALQVRLAEQV